MLEGSCPDCNVPLMRSRENEIICFGCNSVFHEVSKGVYSVRVLSMKWRIERGRATDRSGGSSGGSTQDVFERFPSRNRGIPSTVPCKAIKTAVGIGWYHWRCRSAEEAPGHWQYHGLHIQVAFVAVIFSLYGVVCFNRNRRTGWGLYVEWKRVPDSCRMSLPPTTL